VSFCGALLFFRFSVTFLWEIDLKVTFRESGSSLTFGTVLITIITIEVIIVIIIMTNDDGENNVNTCIPYDFNSRTFTF
jgi:hypothetical protein